MEYKKLVDWQRHVKTKGANKEKLGGGIVTCMGTLRPPTPYLKGLEAHTGERPYN